MTDGTGIDDIRAARDALDAVVDEIRAVPGHADFLAAPTFDDVARVAGESPLLYVAAAAPGGLALIVRGADVTRVALDGLTSAALRDRARRHLAAYADYRSAPDAGRDRWHTALDDLTAWLWDEVAGPLVAALADVSEVALVAGGLLGLLPVHAAWTPDGGRPTGRRYLLDELAISYTPNARSLDAARRLAAEVDPGRLLAIANPWPVAAPALPMARFEAMAAAATFPAQTTLGGGEANFLSFERQAPSADVLHLACHGLARLESPLDSALLLAGGEVTLRRLLSLRLRVRLAVLSACETAMPGTDLPDEVVALPTGLLQAGVAGVVASQWAVPDRATALLMAEFYRCWRAELMAPAAALAAAQAWLRDTTNAEKVSHLRAAVDQRSAWLPEPAARAFLGWLELLTPEKRSHERIHHWGAFAHVGA